MLLADYTLGDALLTVLWIFGFVIFFWLLIIVFGDLFRDHELSGWAKALWVIFVIIFPFLGIFVYLIARGGGMAQRAAAAQARMDQQMRQYVQQAAGGTTTSTADELTKLSDLREKGAISEEEFQSLKAKALASS
jgi:ABC-type multidrug transport system fused ATPase/permease subunit